MLLMIDNYDSFTYNLVQYLAELKQEVEVYRNDEITIDEIKKKNPQYIVLSPGPCTPNEAGVSLEIVNTFKGEIPILGVCLGHQTIGQAFGGKIIHAKTLMHGKTSKIHHTDQGLFV
jgi:anthranilate synthase component 2